MSWPPTTVDWLRLTSQLRHGALVCIVHGLVVPTIADWELPVCPHCRQLLSRAVRDRVSGVLVAFAEPFPAYCSGPGRHRTVDGQVRVGWQSCQCPNAVPGPGGHRWWRCSMCDAYAQWPPHQDELHPAHNTADPGIKCSLVSALICRCSRQSSQSTRREL